MTFIKFCGMTREDDVRAACDLGVHALGFVMWPKSPRCADAVRVRSLVRAMSDSVTPVGVFVSPTREEMMAARDAGVRVFQLHQRGDAIPDGELWIAASLESDLDAIAADIPLVLDAHDPVRHGGTGRTIDWSRAAAVAARRRTILAGGLTVANVATAISQVRPFGVDVASGIEDQPGIKNAQAMKAFVTAVREADQR
jgi:phosphoribosylanthranilate isomerase